MTTSPVSTQVHAVYWRAGDHRLWTHDRTLADGVEADRQRANLVGQRRGRHTIDATTVIAYPGPGDVRAFVQLGREGEAAPAHAATVLQAVPASVKIENRRSRRD